MKYIKTYRKGKKKQEGGFIKDLKETAKDVASYYDTITNPILINDRNLKLKAKINPLKKALSFNTKYSPTKNTTITGGINYAIGSKPQYTAGVNFSLKRGGYRKRYL